MELGDRMPGVQGRRWQGGAGILRTGHEACHGRGEWGQTWLSGAELLHPVCGGQRVSHTAAPVCSPLHTSGVNQSTEAAWGVLLARRTGEGGVQQDLDFLTIPTTALHPGLAAGTGTLHPPSPSHLPKPSDRPHRVTPNPWVGSTIAGTCLALTACQVSATGTLYLLCLPHEASPLSWWETGLRAVGDLPHSP